MATLGSDGNNQQAWSGTVHFTWGTCPLIYHSPLSPLLLTSLTNGHHLLVLWSFEFASPVLGRMRQQPPHIQRPNMHKKEYKSVHLPSAEQSSMGVHLQNRASQPPELSYGQFKGTVVQGLSQRWKISIIHLRMKFPLASYPPKYLVRFLSALRFCIQTVTHFFIIKYLLMTN